ncbi:Aerobic respiration control sensor protein ArcB [Methylobacterium dankookense]|uniref:histidine kinase n=2 Tax=Methylobacterium dankookense TaxID=560405 RepID=A0A564G5N5_9HYPH|nr:CHASE domain-containing protein [Methylobacterium dankookense]GJD56520.1 Adaptive-response sensory-kinase SasA [Methylobacterium dankookense]VUF15316.1 Aerobic respiration control sensor protein ArcB [Methylobacterium dankookense]
MVLIAGLTASVAVALQLRQVSGARDRDRFERLATQQADRIRERLDTYVALLRGTAGLYAASETVTRADFSAYVARLRLADLYPGTRGIGFARRFRPEEGLVLAEAMRAQGLPEFRLRPDPPGTEPSAIVALEPLDLRNSAAMGYDMFSEPVRRAAMARARDTGEAALSGRVELVQEIDRDKQPGFLVYLPVYAGGAVPETEAARRAGLVGWTYSPFRAGDFFPYVSIPAAAGGAPELAFRIQDGPEPGADPGADSPLYASPAWPRAAEAGGLTARRSVPIAGRTWTLTATTTPAFMRDPSGQAWPWILGLGGLVTLALGGAALAQGRAQARSEAARFDLEEERNRLELLNRAGPALVAEHDVERLVQTVIEAATRLVGGAYGAFFERVPAGAEGNAEEVWRLFSLTGGPREAFTRFGLPRATNLFKPTFLAEGVVRSDDVAQDARYGSHGGMPAGHLPVRSYLAVPVMSGSGETLGALLFGHPEPARFGPREERLITGFAAQAAVALDNARLLTSILHGQQRFQAAIQAVRGIMWTNDANGRMAGEQPGWAAITGQSFAEYQDFGWADAVHPDDRQPSVDAWNAAVAGRRTFVHEHRVRSKDGAWRTYAIRAVPVLDGAGAIREWVGVHTDITEQREAEAELRESNEEIQRYAYIVSHDLRAPLVNVMGFTSELEAVQADIREATAGHPKAPQIEGDVAEALGFIRAAITKMEALIAAILKLSREGRRSFRPEPIDMAALMQGLADAQRHQADAAGARVAIAADLPDIVADRLAVQQIFGNLIDNALKYLDPTRPGRITVTGEPIAGGRVRYAVADNGRGIARQDHARIFELFRRAGAQDRPGEGIGLAHVKALVRSLGGRITVSSEPGIGTTFSVTLPRDGAAGAAAPPLAAE